MKSNNTKGFLLYRFFDKRDNIIYVGRTKQKINDRLRGHFFAKPMHKKINIHDVKKIEIAKLKSEADMFLYEIYCINKLKPVINCDDKARDELTVEITELKWEEHRPNLFDKWSNEIPVKRRRVLCKKCNGSGGVKAGPESERRVRCDECRGTGMVDELIFLKDLLEGADA